MILIPAMNEARSVAEVVTGCLEWKLPVVVVDDGSSDSTVEEAERAGAQVISHPKNMGKGRAFWTGFNHAKEHGFEAVITLDGDGQHDPKEIGLFIDEFRRGEADIVLGSRMRNTKTMPLLRRFSNRSTSFIISKITGCLITDSQSGFRLITVHAWFTVNPRTSSFDTESELLITGGQQGLVIHEVPIRTIYGDEKSKISKWRDTWGFIRLALAAMVGRRPPSVVE